MNHKKNDYPSSSQQLTMFEREAPYPTPELVAKEAPPPKSATPKPDTNANREGYKLTKLGWIPDNWNVISLSKLGHWVGGGTPSKEEKSFWRGGEIPWASSQEIKGRHLIKTTYRITNEAVQQSSSKIVPKDSLLMVMRSGILQHTFPVVKTTFPVAINQDIKALTLLPDYDVDFIHNTLQERNNHVLLTCSKTGTTVESIEYTWLKSYLIPIPPLPEQRAIADCLSTWDQAIQTLTQLITQKELRKKWLMQQLLTGKRRLPGFSKEWSTWSFKEILKEVKRPVNWNDEELYNLISVRRRSGGLFHRESLYGHQIKTKNLRTAKSGDFLISKMQIVHGASGLTTDGFDGMKISGSYIAVRAKNESILNTEFLNWYSKLPHFYHQCYISSYGVHIEKMTFDFKLFLKEEISLPPLEEQIAITQVLQRADQEITLINQKLTHLQNQKKGLMQQLLTGKKRLNLNNK